MTVTAQFDGRVFVPDGPVTLPVGARVRVVAEPPPTPLTELAAELAQLPANPDWPSDGAAAHDHHLYGSPKSP